MIIGYLLFSPNKNPDLKRKLFPPFVVGIGILFIGFIYLTDPSFSGFYVIIPATIIIVILNIRDTKFCGSCGKTLMLNRLLTKPGYCPNCGEKLK